MSQNATMNAGRTSTCRRFIHRLLPCVYRSQHWPGIRLSPITDCQQGEGSTATASKNRAILKALKPQHKLQETRCAYRARSSPNALAYTVRSASRGRVAVLARVGKVYLNLQGQGSSGGTRTAPSWIPSEARLFGNVCLKLRA